LAEKANVTSIVKKSNGTLIKRKIDALDGSAIVQ